MGLVKIIKSKNPNKKWTAIFEEPDKIVHFGGEGYTDYTMGATEEQKANYLARHAKDLKGDPTTAGYLSYYILWNKRRLSSSIKDYCRRFGL
jgi:hypothetical protein